MTDKTRKDFEAWAMKFNPQLLITFGNGPTLHCQMAYAGWDAATQQSAARIAALEAEVLALRKDAERLAEKAAIHDAINRACSELPEGYDLHIELEKNAGSVRLYLLDSDCDITDFGSDLTFVETINAAIDAAIEAERGEG